MRPFTIRFASQREFSVVIEADYQKVYAYFLDGDTISGDVWLFNRVAPPSELPWRSGGPGPYLNPAEFAHPYIDAATVNEGDFRAAHNLDAPIPKAGIYLKGRLVAVLWKGARPGKSAFAKAASPAAIPFGEAAVELPKYWIEPGNT